MNAQTGKMIILIGIALVAIGIIVYFFGNKLNWLGRLPGDIRVEREGFKFYFPIVTMLILSGLLNFVIWLVKRFF